MSAVQMREVWHRKVPDRWQQILLILAWYADDEGNDVWASVEWVAWRAGKSVRQVQRVYAKLRERGALKAVRYPKGGGITNYKLSLNVFPLKAPLPNRRQMNLYPSGRNVAPANVRNVNRNVTQTFMPLAPVAVDELVTNSPPATVTQLRHPNGDAATSPQRCHSYDTRLEPSRANQSKEGRAGARRPLLSQDERDSLDLAKWRRALEKLKQRNSGRIGGRQMSWEEMVRSACFDSGVVPARLVKLVGQIYPDDDFSFLFPKKQRRKRAHA